MARTASSTDTLRIDRSWDWPSYAEPLLKAAAKIVGFDVTPITWKSRMSSSRFPVRSRSRLMSSSHTATPSAES